MRVAVLVVACIVPAVLLAADQILHVDLDGDGKPDAVRLVQSPSGVRVAVESTALKSAVHIDFRPPGQQQNAVCSYPVKLVAERIDSCELDGLALPGCRPRLSKWEVAIEDGDCDSIRVYWDHDRKVLEWWRR